jgi:hypothetical protein
LIRPPALVTVVPARFTAYELAGAGAGTPEPVRVRVADPVAATEPPARDSPVTPDALGADAVPVMAMLPEEFSAPDIAVPMIAVAVVEEDTLPVTVRPPEPAATFAVEPMFTPVPALPPTVAAPVSVTWPDAPDCTLPLTCSPVPARMEGLLSVPLKVTLPPELDTVAPLASSPPTLVLEALLPTRPAKLMVPEPVTTAPESSRKPRETCATPDVQPTSPLSVTAPPPAAIVEAEITRPPAELPALAPPLVRLPVMSIVPEPLVVTTEPAVPLVMCTEWKLLAPLALTWMLPPPASIVEPTSLTVELALLTLMALPKGPTIRRARRPANRRWSSCL